MATRDPVAWVLNLDAEDELTHGRTHTPAASLGPRVRTLLPALRGLLQPGDRLVFPPGLSEPVANQPRPGLFELVEDGPSKQFTGRAWCPTRWALKQLEAAGARVPRAPSMDILRRVNHRRFSHELGQALPLAGYATNLAELEALTSSKELASVSVEGQWLLKRPLGYAGRGRKKWRAGAITTEERAWLDASWPEGVQVEPLVRRTLDVALHGLLEEDATCRWGEPTVQDVDASGAWLRSRVATDELRAEEREALLREGERTARALHEAGYFGPFGIDAFRWVDARGAEHFQPRCEINARYSMGWAVGMSGASAK